MAARRQPQRLRTTATPRQPSNGLPELSPRAPLPKLLEEGEQGSKEAAEKDEGLDETVGHRGSGGSSRPNSDSKGTRASSGWFARRLNRQKQTQSGAGTAIRRKLAVAEKSVMEALDGSVWNGVVPWDSSVGRRGGQLALEQAINFPIMGSQDDLEDDQLTRNGSQLSARLRPLSARRSLLGGWQMNSFGDADGLRGALPQPPPMPPNSCAAAVYQRRPSRKPPTRMRLLHLPRPPDGGGGVDGCSPGLGSVPESPRHAAALPIEPRPVSIGGASGFLQPTDRGHKSLLASPRPPPAEATVRIGSVCLKLHSSPTKRSSLCEVAEEFPAEPSASSTAPAPPGAGADGEVITPKGLAKRVRTLHFGDDEQNGEDGGDRPSAVGRTATDSGQELSPARSDGRSSALVRGSTLAGESQFDSPTSLKREECDRERREKDPEAMEAQWRSIFFKLRDDSEIHRDECARALELCGITQSARQDWVNEVFKEMTDFATLEEEEFVRFVRAYQQRQHQAYAEAFSECDDDGSGRVDQAELGTLLRSFGMEPMRHVLQEVLEEVDADGLGDLDLDEFEEVMEVMWTRAGFSKINYEELLDVFRRFDRDGSGEVDTKELQTILGWLGYAFTMQQTAEVVKEVDVDGSGTINEREFIMCMRKVKDRQVTLVRQDMQAHDQDGSGTINMDETYGVLKALGYDLADRQAIIEAGQAANIDAERELDLSDVWKLVGVFRRREGFNASEANLIEEGFNRYDRDQSGEVSTLECGKLLRWLGYPTSWEVQQQYITKVDLDDSGELNLSETMKMVRMFRDRELQTMCQAFEKKQQSGSRLISKTEAISLIRGLGYLDGLVPPYIILDEDRVPGITGQIEASAPCLDFQGFMKTAIRFHRLSRDTYRKNGGFTSSEVDELRRYFQRFDKDNSGDISKKELITLLEEFFPEMANDPQMRPELLRIMKEVDKDASGTLDFPDFLSLMHQLQELQDREHLNKEVTAVKSTGFTAQEVTEFRELFLATDKAGSGEVSFEELTAMLHMIVPLGDKYMSELSEIFLQVTAKQCRVEGHKDQCDFPEFLWLMKRLLDRNFANIKEKTGAAARKGGPA